MGQTAPAGGRFLQSSVFIRPLAMESQRSCETDVPRRIPSRDARKWSPVDSEGRVNGLTIRNSS